MKSLFVSAALVASAFGYPQWTSQQPQYVSQGAVPNNVQWVHQPPAVVHTNPGVVYADGRSIWDLGVNNNQQVVWGQEHVQQPYVKYIDNVIHVKKTKTEEKRGKGKRRRNNSGSGSGSGSNSS